MNHPVVLTIAGSDPSGGAGIQADIKTISALGGYAASAITAITVQNTLGVKSNTAVEADLLEAQIDAVLSDLDVCAVKIGMLATLDNVRVVVDQLTKHTVPYVVCDPVMLSTSGYPLLSAEGVDFAKQHLFPLCSLITPNLPEAKMLGGEGSMLAKTWNTAVLVKGGHSDSNLLTDTLYINNTTHTFTSPRIKTTNLHGTGCTLSSAIATNLANGDSLVEAVEKAKHYIDQSIAAAVELHVGHGNGPLWHFPKALK